MKKKSPNRLGTMYGDGFVKEAIEKPVKSESDALKRFVSEDEFKELRG